MLPKSSATSYYDRYREKSAPSLTTASDAAKLGAKVGVFSVVPASLAGTGVAIVTTGTVTSVKVLLGGLAAGAATFCLCTGAGVVIGAGVGVVIGTSLAVYRKRKRDKEVTMLLNRIDV